MATTTLDQAGRAGAEVADQAADEARQVASTAARRGGELARIARDETQDLAVSVRERASEVTSEVGEQTRRVVDETIGQIETRASVGAEQLAAAIRDLGGQAQALAEGRPEDAPSLAPHALTAADRLYGASDRLNEVALEIEENGFGGLLDDLQTYARRRPGAFLLGAVAVGFGVGRAIRVQRARAEELQSDPAADPDDGSPYGNRGRRPAVGARSAGTGRARPVGALPMRVD